MSLGSARAGLLMEKAEALLQERRTAEAIKSFGEAERLGGDADRCAGGRWLANMLEGRFEAAWRESDEIRRRGRADAHRFWNGEDLKGKRVIVRCLHGYGDAVQMLRYAPKLRGMCGELIVEVPPRLVELAKCFAGVEQVITWSEGAPARAPEWDVQIEVMELPYVFRTELCELPLATGYVGLPAELRKRMAERMGRRDWPRVGLVWSAGEWNRSRCLPAELVERLAAEGGVEFWDLRGEADVKADGEFGPGLKLREIPECRQGIVGLAGVIGELDLVITVDTLAAHLAGALGTPAWVMLQRAADWRWMMDRGDGPWYPSLRLYRQRIQDDWGSVMDEVTRDLRRWRDDKGGMA